MSKKTFAGLIIGSAILFAVGALPASALTIDEVQAQIQSLLSRITELTNQLNVLRGQPNTSVSTSVTGSVMPSPHRICTVLYRNLSQGTRGDDVTSLQEFLKSEGYLSANATGYFGPMTAQAVARWQTSQGVSAVGHFGPMSRERIKIWCGGGGSLQASPTRGNAPLTVHFWHVIGSSMSEGYSMEFGDGTTGTLEIGCGVNPTSGMSACPRALTASHTYTENGTYSASLVHYTNPCGGNPACMAPISREIVGRVQINVGPVVCTKEYKPVCGSKTIVCITTPCNPIQQTYSNRCMMEADGASFLYEGQCRADWQDPANDPQCKSWYDGCNTCSRQYPGGPAMCTLRACMSDMMSKPYCTAWFDEFPSGNKPPVISGFSGPTTLNVNATGTWTINASDPENGQLSYQVSWGDERYVLPTTGVATSFDAPFVQATTFTHAYSSIGTFIVSIIVRDSSGEEARTSTTVKVENTYACTTIYQPVCGQPPWSCPQGMYCATVMPAPQTYSNRCFMNAAGAEFLYDGQCASGY